MKTQVLFLTHSPNSQAPQLSPTPSRKVTEPPKPTYNDPNINFQKNPEKEQENSTVEDSLYNNIPKSNKEESPYGTVPLTKGIM